MLFTAAPFAPNQLRDVLGTFITGVTIVTTRNSAGVAHGITANSFSSVSLDPPLVLWSQSITSRSHSAFIDSDTFAVNILADDQIALSDHFAMSADNKFNGIPHTCGIAGAPVLDGVAAHLECVKVAAYPAGDHVVFIGRIEKMSRSGKRPLAYGSGRYMVASSHDRGSAAMPEMSSEKSSELACGPRHHLTAASAQLLSPQVAEVTAATVSNQDAMAW